MALLDSAARARDSAQSPANLLLESSPVEVNYGESAGFSGANRGGDSTELQLREIKIWSLSCTPEKENLIGFLPKLPFDEEPRKLSLPCVAMQEKYVLHTSPRKGCRLRRWRRVRRKLRDNPLDLDVNFLVLATGYSLGIGSKISGDCINRKRIRMKDFGCVGRIARKSHRRGLRDKEGACIFESYFVTSGAGGAVSNNRHQIMSMSYDGDQSEDRQSEEVQSAYKSHGGGVLRGYFNLDRSEEQNEENEWSWISQDGDPLAESMSSLQTTQEALENEMQKLSELSKELRADNFSSDNRANNALVSLDEDDVLETNQKMSHLEQKLEEAVNTIREKDSRLSQLQELIAGAHIATPEEGAFDIDQLETDLDRQLQEKIEAEIQSLVMLKARQSWQVRTEDQLALKEHKLSSSGGGNGDGDGGNARMMMVKLRETESKIVKLKEQVEKLEVHERELFGTTEVLRMQSRTFKICLFGLLQLILLFLSLKAFFAQVSDPFGDVVPT